MPTLFLLFSRFGLFVNVTTLFKTLLSWSYRVWCSLLTAWCCRQESPLPPSRCLRAALLLLRPATAGASRRLWPRAGRSSGTHTHTQHVNGYYTAQILLFLFPRLTLYIRQSFHRKRQKLQMEHQKETNYTNMRHGIWYNSSLCWICMHVIISLIMCCWPR